MNAKNIQKMVDKLQDLKTSVADYDKKIANLTYLRTSPLTEGQKVDLKTYHEERTNLHGIKTGIWVAAELGGFEQKLMDAVIADDRKRMQAAEDKRFADS